jgi:spore germination protein YaaH
MRMLSGVAVTVAVLAVVAPAAAEDGVGFQDPSTGEWFVPGPDGVVDRFFFGNSGDDAMMGDWDCDGVVTPGLYRRSDGYVYLRNANSQGVADARFFFGNPGDRPLAGDFDGDGCDTVSVWRPDEARVFIINRLGSGDEGLGPAEHSYVFGVRGDEPFVGDFDGDGDDTVGLHRASTGLVYFRNIQTTGNADAEYYFGNPGDRIVAGDWTGSGVDTPTAFRPAERTLYTALTNGGGLADRSCLGGERWWVPVGASLGTAPTEYSGEAVILKVDPAERAALGARSALLVQWAGGQAVLSDCAPSVGVRMDLPSQVTVTYLDGHGNATDISWQQSVEKSGAITISQEWRKKRPAPPGDIVLAWQSTGETPDYLAELDRAPGLTVTSPIWWFIQGDGSLADVKDSGFVTGAHARGVEVWPAIAGLDAASNHIALQNPEGLAATVAARAREVGADGVNVDIEGYWDGDGDEVVRFVAELSSRVHSWGGLVSVDVTSLTDLWVITSPDTGDLFWSTAPRRRELAEAADYLVLMAYDEYNRVRPFGPVASPHWVEDTARYLTRLADPERVILGIPFYGRLWDPDPAVRPRAIGIGSLTSLATSGAAVYDKRFGLDKVTLPDGTFLWVESPEALRHRVDLVEELGLAGLAAWRLGFDSTAIWQVIG